MTFSRIIALSVFSVLAVTGTAVSSSQQAAQTERQVFSIRLSLSEQVRQTQLQKLGAYDVMGVDRRANVADLRLNGKELRELQEQGFDVEFSVGLAAEAEVGAIQDYLSPEKLQAALKKIAAENPDLVSLQSFGKTSEGLDMWAVEITSRSGGSGKPSVIFNSMHHARELMTTEVGYDIVETLVAEYKSNPEVKEWLDRVKVIVVPQVNPDGNNLVHNGQRMWRKNSWKYKGSTVGVDLNRNYPAFWNGCNGSSADRGSDAYRGPSAASEPETQAMMNLVKTKKPVANISYHSFSELIIFPFGCQKEKNPSRELFENIATKMNDGVIDDNGRSGTYEVGTAPEVIYAADGTDVDWQWKEAGVVSFAIEVNSRSLGFQPDYTKWRKVTVERQRGAWKALISQVSDGIRSVEVPLSALSSPTPLVSPKDRMDLAQAQIQVFRKMNNQWVPFDADRPDFAFQRPVRWNNGKAFVDVFVGEGEFDFRIK